MLGFALVECLILFAAHDGDHDNPKHTPEQPETKAQTNHLNRPSQQPISADNLTSSSPQIISTADLNRKSQQLMTTDNLGSGSQQIVSTADLNR